MSFHRMPTDRRKWGLGRLWVCLLACALFTGSGCGSLWPFTSGASTDPAHAKVQADKPKPADEHANKDKPAAPDDDDPPGKWHLLPWKWEIFHPRVPSGEAETLVLHGESLEPEKPLTGKPLFPKTVKELSGAHEMYRLGDYEKAGKVFHRIADDTSHVPPPTVEEARFYEAECLRRQLRYPRACDTYHKLLLDSQSGTYQNGTYKELATRRIFEIANYWLEDTREEIRTSKANTEGNKDKALLQVSGTGPAQKEDEPERKQGKDWKSKFVIGHWEKTKPLFAEEGRALEALQWVLEGEKFCGPLAEQCMFLLGSIQFYREDYKEADQSFSMLVKHFPNGKYAATAVELSIVSKHMSTGGADYDSRKVAEARQMIDRALKSYPTLAHEKKDFLIRQLAACTMQQAEKDYRIADFYRRTGHPGSAYFYYEIVRRRYPGTPYADKATERMLALRRDLEKEQKEVPVLAPAHADREAAPPPRPLARPLTPGTPIEEVAPAPRPVPRETAPAPRLLPNMGQ